MESTKKIGFFKRIKMSIFNPEKYDIFLNERVSVAFRYLLKLILILVAIFSLTTTIEITTQIKDLLSYVNNEFPNFEYKEGILNVGEIVEAYDKKYDAKLIVDTGDEIAQETLDAYNDKAQESAISVILLKDKMTIRANGVVAESTYSNFFEAMGITTLIKSDITSKYNEGGFLFKMGIGIYIYCFMILYLQYCLVVLENIIVVMLFGWVASIIVRAKLKLSKAFSIAIYSLTLSSILNVIYSIIANFTGFEIKYFSLMYLIIGYIYMMTVILMNKIDILESNKKNSENQKENKEDENKNDDIEVDAYKIVEENNDETENEKLEEPDNPVEIKKTKKRKNNKDEKKEDNKE